MYKIKIAIHDKTDTVTVCGRLHDLFCLYKITKNQLQFFNECFAVQDVLRYNVEIGDDVSINPLNHDNKSNKFECSAHYDSEPSPSQSIILVLEAPHVKEFREKSSLIIPIAPAQGTTGRNIHSFINIHIEWAVAKNHIRKGIYQLIICESISWNTSLCAFLKIKSNRELTNEVFKLLWSSDIVKNNFIDRVISYNPRLIFNSCVGKAKKIDALYQGSNTIDDLPPHYLVLEKLKSLKPVKIVSTYHPSSRHFQNTTNNWAL